MKERNQQLLKRHANFLQEYQNGLQYIHKLTDLSHAPDNYMHGNFCK